MYFKYFFHNKAWVVASVAFLLDHFGCLLVDEVDDDDNDDDDGFIEVHMYSTLWLTVG